MSPPEVWGPAIWTLFHTLAEKVTEQAYPFVKVQLFGQIRRICGFLPCPECADDATKFLAKININDLKTKDDFKNTFYLFHNMVNAKKRKPLYNFSNLDIYKKYTLIPVINNFIFKYNTKGNMKLIAESFQRKIVLTEFKSWFTKTIKAFVLSQNIPSPILKIKIEEPVSQEEPAVSQEEPAVSQEEPVVSQEEPVVSQEEPVVSQEEPAVSQEESTVSQEEPTVSQEEPTVSQEEPTVSQEEPAVSQEEPTVSQEEPTVSQEEPAVSSYITEKIFQPKPKKYKRKKFW
jgi:hypothetical protein